LTADVGSGVHTLRWSSKYNTFGSARATFAGHVDLVRIVVNDADGDALPDGWETAHSSIRMTRANAALDRDGDGLANRDEFAALTLPEAVGHRCRRHAGTAGAPLSTDPLSAADGAAERRRRRIHELAGICRGHRSDRCGSKTRARPSPTTPPPAPAPTPAPAPAPTPAPSSRAALVEGGGAARRAAHLLLLGAGVLLRRVSRPRVPAARRSLAARRRANATLDRRVEHPDRRAALVAARLAERRVDRGAPVVSSGADLHAVVGQEFRDVVPAAERGAEQRAV